MTSRYQKEFPDYVNERVASVDNLTKHYAAAAVFVLVFALHGLWENGELPHLQRWFEHVRTRPTFKPAFLDWMPGTLVEELAENGRKSWPEVARLLDLKIAA